MKLLWLCNMMPGAVKEAITGEKGNGLWVDHVLQDLRKQEDLNIRVFCPYQKKTAGEQNPRFSYRTFRSKRAHQYQPELETRFQEELKEFCPDVIHIWGTEFAHTLAMVNAAAATGFLERIVINIQGLCAVYARHYAEGVPERIQKQFTLRELAGGNNIRHQQKNFARRGDLENAALRQVSHVIGRTDWDRACVYRVAPKAAYHFCNETLRDAFYQGQWQYDRCQKHRIFAPSCSYPVKGFHYLLEAFSEVLRDYPDAELTVAGKGYRSVSRLQRGSYQKYLADLTDRYGLWDKVQFLGNLDAEGMKQAYLRSNVFVLPSTIENSPNTLCEAMLLGTPCVAGDVGGVTTLMAHNREGFVYQSTAPYMLANYIRTVFAMGDEAEKMGQAAHDHAVKTHDPAVNFETLLDIYKEIAK